MKHLNTLDEHTLEHLEDNIFPNIFSGNAILFLGAGASWTEERSYLGTSIIDYYQDKLRIDLSTNDLVEFVDRASRLDSFHRNLFDQYIIKLLKRLSPTETHERIVTLDWRQIITTNLDLVIENAYASVEGKPKENKEIVTIRNIGDYNKQLSNNQVGYVKLNGCISDPSDYKFVFSSQDFSDSQEYYNLVLGNLASLSPDVSFISIGYSFTDGLSSHLLNQLNKNNLHKSRKLINIEPYPNDDLTPYLYDNGVISLKCTADEFFEAYSKWEGEKLNHVAKKINSGFYNSSQGLVQIPTKLRLKLNNKLTQLHKYNSPVKLNAQSYYKGEEPNYSIIINSYDVLKNEVHNKIIDAVENSNKTFHNLIPVIFIEGSYGIGKTTSTLRAIDSLQNKSEYMGFEIVDLTGLRPQDVESLFEKSDSENFILYADDLERVSFFKEVMNFRLALSDFQINKNIIFLCPIRENILEIYLKKYTYKNITRLSINHKLSYSETSELIEKLKFHNLIKPRDKSEENKIRDRILKSYNSDPYVTMLSIIENSILIRAIIDTLKMLHADAQNAFLYTSLLYQFKIPMPASVLKNLISLDWDMFYANVLKVDCKGLLINEVVPPQGVKEDLLFRTKHSIISSLFIEYHFKKPEKLYKSYLQVIRSLNPSDEHSKVALDLIKSIERSRFFKDKNKINNLFNEASRIFEFNSNFNIHYAINLQKRRNISSLEKAQERLLQVDSHSDKRNHYVTHRRGVIDSMIAKHYHKEGNTYLRDEHLQNATEFFEIKLSLDPFSAYSYYDFLILEMWKVQNLELSEDEILKHHLMIQDLFSSALEKVMEDSDRIQSIRSKYITEVKVNKFSKNEILSHLEKLYNDIDSRPYALIFKMNTLENEIFDFASEFLPTYTQEVIIEELSDYYYLNDVKKAHFRYHSRRLFNMDSRIEFNRIKDDDFINRNYMEYNFYSYIKESYDYQFKYSFENLKELRENYKILNPALRDSWLDSDGAKMRVFKGIIRDLKSYKIHILELSRNFYILKPKFKLEKAKSYYCNLIFTVKGIRVEIVSEI